MSLMRALFSGVSGLRNHQLYMDVIGNNIANVNTIGFKGGRVTFSEVFAQTLRGATRPVGSQGGTNPIQVGLGMSVATIDTLHAQGSIESTGQVTDLALQGDGFFVVSDGERRYFTRAGSFQFDASGALTMSGTGLRVQGFLANSDGVLEAGTRITDLTFPLNQKIAARATSKVDLGGNLDAASTPLGTILQTERMYAIEEAGDNSDVEGLYASGTANNTISGMIGTQVTITITDPATGNTLAEKTYTYVDADTSNTNGAFHSLDDLIAEISGDTDLATYISNIGLNANGAIDVTTVNTGNTIAVSSTNPILNSALSGLNGTLDGSTLTSDEFSHVARADDTLVNLRNASGVSLGLQVGDSIAIDGQVGGNNVTTGSLTIQATTTYQDFANNIETTLGLINSKGVEISANDGSLVINGDGGKVYELSNIDIVVPGRTEFNNIFDSTPGNYTEIQQAADAQQSSTITVYDSLGNSFDLTLVFTKDVMQPNRWFWTASVPEPAIITGEDSGYVEFNSDGSLKSFVYDDGSTSLLISSGDGSSDLMSIELNAGTIGGFEGITQFSGINSNAIFTYQDGYGMGVLDRLSIDQTGQIMGAFSNGVVKLLGQIVLANFANPGGLLRGEGNLFQLSGNSGDPILTTAGEGINTTIVSGALEQSNVDLAEEFTRMIIAQRGFQANARTITISDDLLSEVTNLKR